MLNRISRIQRRMQRMGGREEGEDDGVANEAKEGCDQRMN